MDFDRYKLRLNLKTMCLFEHLADKSFYEYTDDDILLVLYSSFIANNDSMVITFEAFKKLIEDKKVARWFGSEYAKITKYNAQFSKVKEVKTEESQESGSTLTATEIASILIINGHLDPRYVYYEMDFWEIEEYMKVMDNAKKEAMAEQRLWTYLTIMPHIDTKKCKTPEKLLPFPWEEKEKQTGTKENLTKEKESILAFFKKNKEEETKEDGKEYNDTGHRELLPDADQIDKIVEDREGSDNQEGIARGIGCDSETGKDEPCIEESSEERKPITLIQEDNQ